ncbi:multiple organellar RNA editing factor 7, mitochondrial-like [Andrographis paniculata]|uniref:multiple organellar RNA editing factor 7, mitochondrial-like n=1 Tax=Andrographis paniculata TaxID=175694 RepID=UPI0021E771B7|nr:multiple organellar RNA editing factor 7, mitochondrial-like [Andrographis paniculata]
MVFLSQVQVMRKVLLPEFRAAAVASLRRPFSDWRQTLVPDLPRVDSLVGGADDKHWLVVMHPPDDCPRREEIIQRYVATLAMVLGSETAATDSIYSVSTKYYYAFGCKIIPQMTDKIKLLPHVKWVLPDSYLPPKESGYGGEPFVNGQAVPYEEKYHADWLRENPEKHFTERGPLRKPGRKRIGARNYNEEK